MFHQDTETYSVNTAQSNLCENLINRRLSTKKSGRRCEFVAKHGKSVEPQIALFRVKMYIAELKQL